MDLSFDIFFNQEGDYGEKSRFVGTVRANENDPVLSVKQLILEKLSLTNAAVALAYKFYKTEAVYAPGFGSSGVVPDAPNVHLVTNNNYKLKDILDKIPTAQPSNEINCVPIFPWKIVAHHL